MKNIRLKPQRGLINLALKNECSADLNPWPAVYLLKQNKDDLFILW